MIVQDSLQFLLSPGQQVSSSQWVTLAQIDSNTLPLANITAYAYGTVSTGPQLGLKITWNFIDSIYSYYFLNVSPAYFYLKVQNNDSTHSVDSIYVNYGLSSQTAEQVTVPNYGTVNGIGFYSAQPGTKVHIVLNNGSSMNFTPSLPDTVNQYALVTIP